MKFLTAAAAAILCGAAAFAADSPDVKKFSFSNDVEVYAIRDKESKMGGSLFSDYTKTSDLKQKDLKKEYPAEFGARVYKVASLMPATTIRRGRSSPSSPRST